MNDKTSQKEVVIIGGSVVGLSFALSLAKKGISSTIIEAKPKPEQDGVKDVRAFALSQSTVLLYETLGIWSALNDATQIKQIHISEQDHFGYSRLNAEDADLSELGYIVNAYEVLDALYKACVVSEHIELVHDTKVTAVTETSSGVELSTSSKDVQQTLSASYAIGCDGANSKLAELLSVEFDEEDYEQTAISTTVTVQKQATGVAYERFTTHGPLALLPLPRQQYGLVWTHTQELSKHMNSLSESDFLKELQKAFGYRLGKFTGMTKRVMYPLKMKRATQQVIGRCLLLGNSAHSLHPAAGQGLNLALRDCAYLADHAVKGVIFPEGVLADYEKARQRDQNAVAAGTDKLVKLFSNSNPALLKARTLGLLFFDILPFKKPFIRRATFGTDANIHTYTKLEVANETSL